MNRVAITGLGTVNALGQDAGATARALRQGRSAIGPLTGMATDSLQIKIGAQAAGFDPLAHFEQKRLSLLDRCSQLALVAAREAVAQSGLEFRGGLVGRGAAIIGSGVG